MSNKYQLKTSVSGTSGYIPKFTGTNTIGNSTLSQHSTGALDITASGNTTTIGSQNSSYCHIYNSLNIPFIFNQGIQVLNNKDLFVLIVDCIVSNFPLTPDPI